MNEIRRTCLAASTAVLLAAPGAPGALGALGALAAQEVEVGGQIRPRYEARDPGTGQENLTFTSMRSRLDFTVPLESWFTAFIQVQDVRFWGEEEGTRADDLDVHQAWADIGSATAPLGVRVGRQEVAYGGERLVGPLDWAPRARAFDGVVARVAGSGLRSDLFGFQLRDADVGSDDRDEAFYGSWTAWTPTPGHTLHLHVLWNRGEGVAETDTRMDQWTPGLRYEGRMGAVDYRIQGAWQTGQRDGVDVEAWILAARLGAAVAEGRGHVALWYDHLSGDDGTVDGETNVFSTLFATNHKFYGYADLFTDIPRHTVGRGLRDVAVKTRWTAGSPWTVTLDLHHFRVAEDRGLASGRLGEEIDLTLGRTLASGARLSGGVAWVGSGEALAELRDIQDNVLFGYVMLDVVF